MAFDDRSERSAWLTPERQAQLRIILLALVLFFGLVVWVFHSIAAATQRPPEFVHKLRVVGVMTWIYALVQLVDMRWYIAGLVLFGATFWIFPIPAARGERDADLEGDKTAR